MLSDVIFINALYQIVFNFFVCALGLFFIIQARRTKTQLLFYYGLGTVLNSIAFGWSIFTELMTILITGGNMNAQLLLYMVWGPGAFSTVLFGYIWAKILIPEKKWYFLSLLLTLSTLYLLDLFIFSWTTNVIEYPDPPGSDLLAVHHALRMVNGKINYFIIRWQVFHLSYSIFVGVGILYKAIGTKSLIKKKYFYLSTGLLLFNISRFVNWNFFGANLRIEGRVISTLIDLTSYIFSYLALRAEPEERKKKVKKKITTKDSLFRVIERPLHISEADITYYKEQKICLVCKSKVGGFNTYICPSCDVLYCQNCAKAITNLDNACWVCELPIETNLKYNNNSK